MASLRHLVRRTWLSFVDNRASAHDVSVVRQVLTDPEFALWTKMQAVDQRHSVRVFECFQRDLADATRDESAAVLLHDVGKSVAMLGTFSRIAATLGLLRGARARSYRRHEAIGIELAREAGVGSTVISLLSGVGRKEFFVSFAHADDE